MASSLSLGMDLIRIQVDRVESKVHHIKVADDHLFEEKKAYKMTTMRSI